jgi:DNA-binding transcriptional LysR family regulator
MTSFAKNGIGIACIPKEFVKHELTEEKSLFEIKTEPSLPTRAIGLAVPKDVELTFAVKEFVNMIKKHKGE